MATRLYLTKRPPGTFLQDSPKGTWSGGESTRENRGINNHFTFLAAQTKDNGGTLEGNTNAFNGTTTEALLINSGRWVTKPLETVVMGGTFNLCVALSGDPTDNNQYKVHIYITTGDTLTVRHLLVDNYIVNMNPTPSGPVSKFFNLNVAATVAAETVVAGDRIAIELGWVVPTANLPNNYSLYIGTTDGSNTNLADAAVSGTDINLKAPWFEFTSTLVEQADPAAPANDACADAEVIASVPFQASAVDTTTAVPVATFKSIWYTWNASFSGVAFATAIRCNYRNSILVYTGGCGGLTPVLQDGIGGELWLGVGQSIAAFVAVSGTDYWIEVRSYQVDSLEQALNCGGSMAFGLFEQQTTPADDDIFVNCQHVVSYRSGSLINCNSQFYGLTPTGMAIDYTLRPLDDLNGGTNTQLRLYFCLFGDTGLVEIVNISDLCYNTAEVDFIFDPIWQAPTFADRGQNLASIIFDLAGNIYLGWFGDGYSVIGSISTTESCAIRTLDGTHADDQASAPWPLATTLSVNQDVGGSNYLDLAVDQDTIYYTSSGELVKVFSISGSMNLPDFATVPNASGPRPGTRGLRLLPPGDGTGGMLVANGSEVVRLDSSGAVITHYTPGAPAIAQDIDKVEISKDHTTFWASDQLSTRIFHFNLASGALLDTLETNLPAGQLSGFAIYNGYRAAISPPGPPGTGGIVVNKITVPASAQSFDFTATGLTPATFSLINGGSQLYSGLTPGSGMYAVVETEIDGWDTSYVVSNGTIDDIVVVAGETTVVTVTNVFITAQLSGIYKIVPDKTNDTLWASLVPPTTIDVKIP